MQSTNPQCREARAIELALLRFSRRSWKEHLRTRLGAIGASSIFVCFLVSLQWGAFIGACALLGLCWDLYAVTTLNKVVAEFPSFDASQARRERTFVIGRVAIGSVIYCLPYAALSYAPLPGPILGIVFASGAMSLIIAQNIITKTMSLWALPAPTVALAANAVVFVPTQLQLGCAAFTLLAASNAHMLARASWRASQDLIAAQLDAESVAANLDELVKERTRDLGLAIEKARFANEQKSAFLSAASHDLRQPLQAAASYISVVESRAPADVAAIAAKALTALDVTNDILGALLDMSRLEAGAIEVRKKDFSVESFFERLRLQFEGAAADKRLQLIFNPTTFVLHSDPNLLERIAANYLSNAIRYTQTGAVEVGCTLLGSLARVSVRDTGAGIPSDQLTSIFGDFVQLNNDARSRSLGYGLGLSVAKRVASIIGCKIGVESRLGEGSTFWVDVPLAETAPEPLNLVANAPTARHFTHVLLVEDDEMVAAATRLALEGQGYRPEHASSFRQAITIMARGYRPDVILSDFRLPDGNGVELIRTLRSQSASQIPSIVLTGDTVLNAAETAEMGIEVLRKPVSLHVLFKALNTLRTLH